MIIRGESAASLPHGLKRLFRLKICRITESDVAYLQASIVNQLI